ncbi:hypothetical protein QOZ84_00155 [Romboutsia sedimentorum]|uniref:Uncharacterized protein n=1 Tax=Romboutsia sedimentorum TaxID=1368474 RepID=A0ABT7E4U6_9FIRM|nr:hypothetical protein [Romboutsia sedimentorum]MDK2561944.1 hypothetical protein [Romboutsia sedimentorum]
MNLRFANWYTQALGAILGGMACIYSYLNGSMIIYSNIDTYFDSLWFGGIISSYFLLPLCIITFLLAIVKSYNPSKLFLNISIENINISIIVVTVIIGFMGTRIYFSIPAVFILFNLITYKKTIPKEIVKDTFSDETTMTFNKTESLDISEKELKILTTKREIAVDLLLKEAQTQFIMEITGLSLKELKNLEEELKSNVRN